MPRLNGIQAVERINSFIEGQNKLCDANIVPPKIVFLTAHKTSHLDKFLDKPNVGGIFEKPLSNEQVASIFGLALDV